MAMSKPKRMLVCHHQANDDSLGLSADTVKEIKQSWSRVEYYGVSITGNALFTRYSSWSKM